MMTSSNTNNGHTGVANNLLGVCATMGGSISAKVLLLGLDGSGKVPHYSGSFWADSGCFQTSLTIYLEDGPHSSDPKPSVGFDTKGKVNACATLLSRGEVERGTFAAV